MLEEMVELTVIEQNEEGRVDNFLQKKLEERSKNYIQKLIKEEMVKINGNIASKKSQKVKIGDKIELNYLEEKVLDIVAEDIEIDIVYQDEDLAVINKKAGMVVHPAPGNYEGTLVNAIMYHFKDLSAINGVIRPGIVHRLDKDTSGLIIIAKNNKTHQILTDMFKERKIKKNYLAIVTGGFKDRKGRIDSAIGRNPKNRKKMAVVSGGKRAITNYKVLESKEGNTLLMVDIETGRTHQIRVHMKFLGKPILGDAVYGKEDKIAKRQMLHAYSLEFKHPITEKDMKFIGEIPEDFKKVVKIKGLEDERIGMEI